MYQLKHFTSVSSEAIAPGKRLEVAAAEVERVVRESGVLALDPALETAVKRLDLGRFGSILFPAAPQPEGMGVVSALLFTVATVLYDDVFENSRVRGVREVCADALLQPEEREVSSPTTDTRLRSFHTLFAHIGLMWKPETSGVPRAFKREMHAGLVDYLESILQETEWISSKTHPGVSDYMTWRAKSSGGQFGPLLAELGNENFLTDTEREDPRMKRFGELYNLSIMYQNDYVSFKTGRDEGRLNLVFALTRTFGISRESAMQMIFQMHESVSAEMHTLMQTIKDEYRSNDRVCSYVQHVKQSWIGATLYHEFSGRFHQRPS